MERENTGNGRMMVFVVLFAAVFVFALVLSIIYLQFAAMVQTPSLLNPPIKFIVGSPSEVNTSNMIQVPLNQTFCPENTTIIQKASLNNQYLYYTNVQPGQEFKYSLIYDNKVNASTGTMNPVSIIVLPPFKLVSFTNELQTRQDCAGYPNALANATVTIQAPNSSYFGAVNILVYS